MMKKISQHPSPLIAGVVKERSIRSSIAEIRNCIYDGATLIDLHLSALEDTSVDALRQIIATSPTPVLALNYNSAYDLSDAGFTEDERVASMLRAVEAGASAIDMQGYTFDLPSKDGFVGEDKYSFTKGGPKEVVTDDAIIAKQCELIERVHSAGAEVLLSCHPGIPMSPDAVVELALFLEKRRPDVIKIVSVAKTEDDLMNSIKAMAMLKKEVHTPISYHASGKDGILSRVINPILGGHIAFCVGRYNERSIVEQPQIKSMSRIVDEVKRMI